MRVLGIETSCDETGVAVYDTDRGLLAHALFSQIALHAEYGGVVQGHAEHGGMAAWPGPWTFPPCACTTWKATCWRPCSRTRP